MNQKLFFEKPCYDQVMKEIIDLVITLQPSVSVLKEHKVNFFLGRIVIFNWHVVDISVLFYKE